MKKLMEYLADALLIGAGISFIYIFGSIIRQGAYWAGESNPTVLRLELGLAIAILVIGIERIIEDFKSK